MILPTPDVGLEEYANAMFFVTSDGTSGTIHADPADAIAEAEELAAAEGAPWHVIILAATDDPPVHVARPGPRKKARRRHGLSNTLSGDAK